ncbi:MAG: hypothetical protein NT069_17800 [Planctomycetota bacterium]|nr:hypothetical protein [Planctomycetota bacterium]
MLRLSSFSPRAVVQAGWAAIPRLAVLCGAGSATVLALLCLQWTVRLGTSHPVALGLVGCVSVLLALGRLLPTPTSPGLAAFGRLFAVLSLAAWCAGSPWILSGITDRLLSPEWIRPDAGGLTAVALVVATALFLGVPAVLAGWMSAMPGSDRHPGRSPAGYLMGAALGFAGGGLLLSQWLGPYAAALACLLPAIGAAAWSAWQYSPSNALAAHDAPPAAITSPAPALLARLVLASSPLAGLALGTLNEICSQLVPTTAFVAGGMLLGVLTGAGLGLILAGRRKDSSTVSLFAALVQGAAPLGIIAAFPVLVRCNLWWSASISSTGLLATIRTLLPATASLLVVAPAVCLLMRGTAGRNNATGWNVAGFLMAVAGWICAPAVIDSLGGPVLLLSLCGWCGVALAGLAAWKHSNLPVGRWSRATAALLLAVMALGSAVPGAYNPARSARTLFSTQSFTAYATGMRSELLPYLDEGRLVETVRGSRGVYTVWKYAGHQFQIRANGIPKGVVSADPSVFPRHLSETLQVVVPLTLHESPRRLMLLGLGTGEALSVGMKFPLESVVCAEVDPALVNLVKRATDDSTEPNPWDDEKLSLKSCDAILALASEEEGCDVIVSAPDAIALLHSQVCVTREFYALASQRLATDGIFCQRIQAFDFGPAPLRVIAQTMQQAFADVVMVEAGAGEYLFLGTNSPKGLYRGKLPNRLEQEHVRNVLGESGIDWSMVLNLSAVEKYGLVAFAAELPQKEPRLPSCVFTSEEVFQGERAAHTAPLIANSAASSLMPLALPREVMRWGLKIDESHREVQPLAGRLLDWIPPDSSQPECYVFQGIQPLLTGQ